MQKELKASLLGAIAMAEAQNELACLVSLRSQLKGLYPLFGKMDEPGKAQTTIDLGSGKFPFVFQDAVITMEKLAMFVFVKRRSSTHIFRQR